MSSLTRRRQQFDSFIHFMEGTCNGLLCFSQKVWLNTLNIVFFDVILSFAGGNRFHQPVPNHQCTAVIWRHQNSSFVSTTEGGLQRMGVGIIPLAWVSTCVRESLNAWKHKVPEQSGMPRPTRHGPFRYQHPLSVYRVSHYIHKTVMRPSYLYTGISILVRQHFYFASVSCRVFWPHSCMNSVDLINDYDRLYFHK